ncbi:MAG TPA: hypothetical protein VGI26_08530 [Solirubrobacteraceae bacterium]|jgi:hypothetical protein
MSFSNETKVPDTLSLARSAAIGAGDMSLAVRGELTRILATNGNNRRKALRAGFEELLQREALSRAEMTELSAIVDQIFEEPQGPHPKTAERLRACYRKLILDSSSSPAALAIASVVNSLLNSSIAKNDEPKEAVASSREGDVLFGSFGAVVGAGIGWGIGGPIGAGVGAVVGAAVGVCIEEGE